MTQPRSDISCITICLAGTLLIGASVGAADMTLPAEEHHFPPCPSSLAEAETLRSNMLAWTQQLPSDDRYSAGTLAGRLSMLGQQIETCFRSRRNRQALSRGGLPESTGNFSGSNLEFRQAQACFENALNFSRTLSTTGTAPANTNLSAVAIPADLLDPELSLATMRESTAEQALAIIERLNRRRGPAEQLVAAPFNSLISAPDDGYSLYRFLVYVPGEPRRYVMFAGRNNHANFLAGTSQNISVVGITRNNAGELRSYYADYDRNFQARDRRTGAIIDGRAIRNWETIEHLHSRSVSPTIRERETAQNCGSCHKHGPIPIVFPDMEKSPFIEQIRRINSSMRLDAPPALSPRNRMNSYPALPAIGPERERADAWFDRCIQKAPGIRERFPTNMARDTLEYRRFRGEIAQAMNCASCHNGQSSHHLTFAHGMFRDGRGGLRRLEENILYNDMPRAHKLPLSRQQREALAACLTEEYLFSSGNGQPGLLMQWALGESCLPSQGNPGVNSMVNYPSRAPDRSAGSALMPIAAPSTQEAPAAAAQSAP